MSIRKLTLTSDFFFQGLSKEIPPRFLQVLSLGFPSNRVSVCFFVFFFFLFFFFFFYYDHLVNYDDWPNNLFFSVHYQLMTNVTGV